MNNVREEEEWFLGHRLIRKSQTESLRKQMQEFVSDHRAADPKTVRKQVTTKGTDLSEVVTGEREERL